MKLIAIVVLGIITTSCTIESITNTTTTINNINYYGTQLDKANVPINGEPWIEIDSTIIIGNIKG